MSITNGAGPRRDAINVIKSLINRRLAAGELYSR